MFPSLPSFVIRPTRFLPLAGLLGCLVTPSLLPAASYYVDPATGSMSNPGTSTNPWSTLQDVFTANKTFAAGDVIYLRNGYHGIPTIKGLNTGVVTIQPDGTATPKLSRLAFNAAKNWVVSGLDICPENAAAGTYSTTTLVNINGSCSYITLQNSNIRSANSIAGWTQQNWYDRAANGYNTYGPYSVLSNCQITNTDFSVALVKSATNSLVTHNTITNFYGDAMRGLSDFSTFEYNTVMNSYIADSNHDDCFQSWSTDSAGQNPGSGVIYNVTVRNNLLMGLTDAAQPLYNGPQGISNFDGFSENWVIENNVVFCTTYHGIALYGATNCKILNNTVLPNPLDTTAGVTPWILITEHKANADGSAWPVKSSGNLIRNNISARAQTLAASAGTADHNIVTTAYATYFRDYPNFDVGLISTSPAVNAGLDTGAPATDFADHARTTPYDIGAYEYLPRLYEPFNYATGKASTVPDSPSDYGFLGTNWTNDNIVAPGLTFGGMATSGNALQFSSNVAADRSIDMQSLPASAEKVDTDGVTRLGAAGSTIWIRFLIRADAVDTAGTLTGGLNLNGAASGGTTKLSIGDTGTNANWSLNKGGTIGASTTPIVQSQVTLLVVRIAFVTGTNNDQVDLFVNPPSGANPPATPSATLRNVDIGTFDRLEFKGTRLTTVDEVSLATSWGAL